MALRGPAGITISNTGVIVICLCVIGFFMFTFRSSFGEEGQANQMLASQDKSGYKISELLSASIYLCEKAGGVIKKIRESGNLDETSKGETKEGVNDPLTEGDLASHRIIVKGMMKAFPQLNLVSEEHEVEDVSGVIPPSVSHPEVLSVAGLEAEVPYKDITVWIDPLDATKEFTENLIEYVTVMACVAVKGVPVAGVIRKPFTDETYWAWVDHGKSSNLDSAHGSVEGDAVRVIVSRSHAGEVVEVAKDAFKPKEAIVTPAGGAGYKTLEVIKGTQDVYTHVTLIKKWDICSGDAILRAIGGKQSDLSGHDIDYDHSLDPKMDGGLIATIHDHEKYRTALQKFAKKSK